MAERTPELIECDECGARVENGSGIGHAHDCSKSTDDGSEAVARAWIDSRPPAVRAAFMKYPATHLFRMKSTGHTVFITRYESSRDDGSCTTCRVAITRKFNPEILFEREVFNVELAGLEDLGEYVPSDLVERDDR